MVDTVGGSFDENIGRVEVRLQSRVLAEQFYSVLEKARSVHELKINLDWEASYSDFKKLRDSLNKTSVAVLDFSCGHGPASDILNRKRRYDPIIQIMRHPSIQSFEIANVPKDFFRRASELTKDLDLSNLRHLGFTNFCYDHPFDDVEILMINTLVRGASHLSSLSLVTITDFFKGSKPWPKDLVFPDLKYLDVGLVLTDEDVNNLKSLVTRAPNLSLLSIDTAPERLPVVYISISDVITCTTDFKNKMRFSPPKNTSPYDLRIGPSQLFRDHGAQLESLNCKEVLLNESDMSILDEATQNGSSLKELYCTGWASDTSDETIKSLAKIIARSELHLLRTALWKDDVSACILQSIQWEHLRELETAEGEEELKAFSEEISKRVELGYLKHRTIPAEPVIKDTPETNPAIGTRTIKMRDTRDEGSVYAHYDYTITFTPGQLRPTVEEETTVISITSRS
ncbi:hypothetical protein BGX20_009175 [Mortierella sp. AD010]|nr:hypothetical protein BGX20_009175 [Mortierella sp. AD010]